MTMQSEQAQTVHSLEEEMEELIWEHYEKSIPESEMVEMREQYDQGWDEVDWHDGQTINEGFFEDIMVGWPAGGEWEIATLADYATVGDSVSLAKIGDKPFTIIHIEDSDYTQGDEITKGVKITTKETFEVDGNDVNKFHTTRIAIVKRLDNSSLRSDVNGGKPLGPVRCVEEKAKSGKSFYNLADVEDEN